MSRVKYTPDYRGLAELGRTAAVQAVAVEGARRVAAGARAVNPNGEYSVRNAGVTSGWKNELRSGAVVTDEKNSGRRLRSLQKGIEAARE